MDVPSPCILSSSSSPPHRPFFPLPVPKRRMLALPPSSSRGYPHPPRAPLFPPLQRTWWVLLPRVRGHRALRVPAQRTCFLPIPSPHAHPLPRSPAPFLSFPRPVSPHCAAVTIAVPRVRPALVCTTAQCTCTRGEILLPCVCGDAVRFESPHQRTWAHRAHLPIPILPLFPVPSPPRSHHTPPRSSRCIAVAVAVPCVRPALVYTAAPPHNAPAPTRVHLALCTGCCLRALAPTLGANSVRVQTSLPRVRRVRRVSAPDIHAGADRVCAGSAVATPPHTPAPLHPHPLPSPLPSSHPHPLPSFPSLPCPFPPRSHHTHPVPPHCVTVAVAVRRVHPAVVYTAAQRTRAESIAPGTVPGAVYAHSHTRSAANSVRVQMLLPRVRRARRAL
ncbi:hypothetical protein B0H16DRAFT_280290 [Mycena metata]|uniref:Uncharacterized protein n=1 Tax=Mycena metata TaxID=1033252 RepID=A0AAD7HQY1_9AGAR|nr:hypothetical protein B0H16DRAFT_280290 [Mycena metata]